MYDAIFKYPARIEITIIPIIMFTYWNIILLTKNNIILSSLHDLDMSGGFG